jgi:hypothetical protein
VANQKDDFVEGPAIRHPGGSRGPEHFENNWIPGRASLARNDDFPFGREFCKSLILIAGNSFSAFSACSAVNNKKKLGRRFSQKKRINPQGAKMEPSKIPLNPPFFKGGDYSPPFIKGRLGGISGMAKQFWSFIISYTIKN